MRPPRSLTLILRSIANTSSPMSSPAWADSTCPPTIRRRPQRTCSIRTIDPSLRSVWARSLWSSDQRCTRTRRRPNCVVAAPGRQAISPGAVTLDDADAQAETCGELGCGHPCRSETDDHQIHVRATHVSHPDGTVWYNSWGNSYRERSMEPTQTTSGDDLAASVSALTGVGARRWSVCCPSSTPLAETDR